MVKALNFPNFFLRLSEFGSGSQTWVTHSLLTKVCKMKHYFATESEILPELQLEVNHVPLKNTEVFMNFYLMFQTILVVPLQTLVFEGESSFYKRKENESLKICYNFHCHHYGKTGSSAGGGFQRWIIFLIR